MAKKVNADEELSAEAVDVMRSGGLQVVEDAIAKWWSGKYGPNLDPQSHIQRWRKVGERIAEITSDLKKRKRGK